MDGRFRVPTTSGVKADAIAYVLPTHSNKLSDEFEGSFMIYNFLRSYAWYSMDVSQVFYGVDTSEKILASASEKTTFTEAATNHFWNDRDLTIL